MHKIELPFIVRLTLALFSILMLGYIAIIGKNILSPLLFSLLLGFLMLPLANFFERKMKLKRSFATIVTVIIMLTVLYAIAYFFASQLTDLWNDWPLLEKQVTNAFHEIQHWISKTFRINISKQETYLADSAEKALTTSAAVVGTTLITLSSSLLFLVFTLLFTFFILNYRKLLYNFITSVFKDEHLEKVKDTINEVKFIIKKYITGLFIQMVVVSVLTISVLSILGVKYAILLGLIAGIFNIIPYLGISFALLISLLITFATATAAKAFFVLLAYIGIHAVDSNILMPLIIGSKVKINALIAFIGIVVGEMLWGISGMFLCMPFLAIFKIIFQKVDDLKPWAILLGEEEKPESKTKRALFFKRKFQKKMMEESSD